MGPALRRFKSPFVNSGCVSRLFQKVNPHERRSCAQPESEIVKRQSEIAPPPPRPSSRPSATTDPSHQQQATSRSRSPRPGLPAAKDGSHGSTHTLPRHHRLGEPCPFSARNLASGGAFLRAVDRYWEVRDGLDVFIAHLPPQAQPMSEPTKSVPQPTEMIHPTPPLSLALSVLRSGLPGPPILPTTPAAAGATPWPARTHAQPAGPSLLRTASPRSACQSAAPGSRSRTGAKAPAAPRC